MQYTYYWAVHDHLKNTVYIVLQNQKVQPEYHKLSQVYELLFVTIFSLIVNRIKNNNILKRQNHHIYLYLNVKIIPNFYTKNYIFTIIITIIIAIHNVSIISIFNTLSVDGQTSSLSSIFDISECDQVINATSSRGMTHGSITNDCINGTNGNDILFGGLGYDILNGNEGDDELIGDSGNDKLYGGAGDDDLVGNLGDDFLDGGDGNDVLKGGKGDDKLIGGNGDDTLIGNSGADFYICGPGNDIAVQFNSLEGDKKTVDCETVTRWKLW